MRYDESRNEQGIVPHCWATEATVYSPSNSKIHLRAIFLLYKMIPLTVHVTILSVLLFVHVTILSMLLFVHVIVLSSIYVTIVLTLSVT